MEMTFRWFGSKYDSVTLSQIRQIPGVKGVITTLYDTTPGEAWERDRIKALKNEIEDNCLKISGIESVNVCDSIKIGEPDRPLPISERKEYTRYVTISCPYSTGRERNLPG